MSAGDTVAHTHRDSLWNFHAVLNGTKRFILSPPDQFRAVGDRRRLGFRLEETPDGRLVRGQSPIEEVPGFIKTFSGFSALSLASTDHNLPVAEAVLSPGDVLFMPPGWWHEVYSYADERGRCLALNWWQQVRTEPFLKVQI